MTTRRKIGATVGLATRAHEDRHEAEQVYVHVDPAAGEFPIDIDVWVGYRSTAFLRITPTQAADLIGLLARALTEGGAS